MSAAATRALVVAAAALAAALLTGHPLLAVPALPLLIALATSRGVRGRGPAPARSGLQAVLSPARATTGQDVHVHLTVYLPQHGPGPAALCLVEVHLEGVTTPLVSRLVPPPQVAGPVTIDVPLRAGGRGRIRVRNARVLTFDAAGTPTATYLAGTPPTVPVVPTRRAPDVELALRAARTAGGVHRSPAAGSGEDFRGVRALRRGDDLRHVNWRASRRRGELMLNERTAERSGDVVLVLATGPASTPSLEAAVATAAGLLQHLLARGDRVHLAQAGGRALVTHSLTGRAGLTSGTSWLADITPTDHVHAAALPARHPVIRPGATCLLLGSLLDDAAVDLLLALHHRGHPTLLRDVDGPHQGSEPAEDDLPALRLVDIRRAARTRDLQARGVHVLAQPLLPQHTGPTHPAAQAGSS